MLAEQLHILSTKYPCKTENNHHKNVKAGVNFKFNHINHGYCNVFLLDMYYFRTHHSGSIFTRD